MAYSDAFEQFSSNLSNEVGQVLPFVTSDNILISNHGLFGVSDSQAVLVMLISATYNL